MRMLILLCLAAGLSMPAASAQAQRFSKLFIFGDSLSDVGNLAAATGGLVPAAPFFEGRFSNGPIYAEVLAAELGLAAATPSRQGGTNYAWAGAFSDLDRAELGGLLTIPSVRTQVADYLKSVDGVADPAALYVFFPGGSDVDRVLDDGFNARSGAALISAAVAAAAEALQALAAAGAATVLIPNVPDMDITPQHAGKPGATELTVQYNQELRAVIDGITTAAIVYFDNFAFTTRARADFAMPDRACFDEGSGSLCDDPENHLFFDDLHPSALAHRSLGLAMAAALEEQPTAMAGRSWGWVKATFRGP